MTDEGRRRYAYVGKDDLAQAAEARSGSEIRSAPDLARWLELHAAEREGGTIPATFVVALDGCLRLASRRSEHVASAAGQPVLSAGEVFLSLGARVRVAAVSNLSTGYCPEPESWPAVAEALAHAGQPHPGRFTSAFTFRRCPACGQRNLVKEAVFTCAVCGADLPSDWNFA
jgi:hypothetical protein